MPSVQTRRKRTLGRFLAELRDRAGLKPEAVATLLRKTPSAVSRIENGHTLCDFSVLTAILGFYRATPEQRKQAEQLWEEAKRDAESVKHSTAMPSKYRAFVKAWDDAMTARTIGQTILPGILQISAYRAALFRAMARRISSPDDAERDATLMEHRRKRLRGPDELEYTVLLDEAVIHRPIGGPAVMAEQLRHLLRFIELPNVTILVIPFDACEYSVMTGGVTILGFDEPEGPDAVYLEYPGGGEWIKKVDEVEKFAGAFEDARSLALTVEQSAALIGEGAERLEQAQ